MPKTIPITVRVENLEKFKRLYEAVHAVLYQRLEVGWGQRDQINIGAWNELIEAHDDIAGSRRIEGHRGR